jgi:predicted small secreted protein
MKKHIYSITIVAIAIVTLVLISKAVAVSRDTAVMRVAAAARDQGPVQGEQMVAELSAAEMVTVKHTVEGLISHYRLPLSVVLQRKNLKINPIDDEPVSKDAKAEASKDKNAPPSVLKDFSALTGFFSALSTISYRLDVSELCIGTDCPKGFSMTAEINRL